MPRSERSRPLADWARDLGCSIETLRRAIRRKELLATKDPLARGLRLLVTPKDMADFLEKRRSS